MKNIKRCLVISMLFLNTMRYMHAAEFPPEQAFRQLKNEKNDVYYNHPPHPNQRDSQLFQLFPGVEDVESAKNYIKAYNYKRRLNSQYNARGPAGELQDLQAQVYRYQQLLEKFYLDLTEYLLGREEAQPQPRPGELTFEQLEQRLAQLRPHMTQEEISLATQLRQIGEMSPQQIFDIVQGEHAVRTGAPGVVSPGEPPRRPAKPAAVQRADWLRVADIRKRAGTDRDYPIEIAPDEFSTAGREITRIVESRFPVEAGYAQKFSEGSSSDLVNNIFLKEDPRKIASLLSPIEELVADQGFPPQVQEALFMAAIKGEQVAVPTEYGFEFRPPESLYMSSTYPVHHLLSAHQHIGSELCGTYALHNGLALQSMFPDVNAFPIMDYTHENLVCLSPEQLGERVDIEAPDLYDLASRGDAPLRNFYIAAKYPRRPDLLYVASRHDLREVLNIEDQGKFEHIANNFQQQLDTEGAGATYVICNTGGNHWVLIAIIKQAADQPTRLFYLDSLNSKILEPVRGGLPGWSFVESITNALFEAGIESGAPVAAPLTPEPVVVQEGNPHGYTQIDLATLDRATDYPNIARDFTTEGNIDERRTHISLYHFGTQNKLRRRDKRDGTINMEDAHVELPEQGFFGVFDGHGGAQASAFVAAELHNYFMREKEEGAPTPQALVNAFEKASADYTATPAMEGGPEDGTTIVVAYLERQPDNSTQLYIANAGDARAVLSSGGQAIVLSHDHTPNLESEEQRLPAELIYTSSRSGNKRLLIRNIPAQFANLAVSRAIGDQMYIASGLTATPEILSKPVFDQDEFLILACDGVWDVLSNQGAVTVVAQALAERPNSPGYAAMKLVEASLVSGSNDNISASIIPLAPYRSGIQMAEWQPEFWDPAAAPGAEGVPAPAEPEPTPTPEVEPARRVRWGRLEVEGEEPMPIPEGSAEPRREGGETMHMLALFLEFKIRTPNRIALDRREDLVNYLKLLFRADPPGPFRPYITEGSPVIDDVLSQIDPNDRDDWAQHMEAIHRVVLQNMRMGNFPQRVGYTLYRQSLIDAGLSEDEATDLAISWSAETVKVLPTRPRR